MMTIGSVILSISTTSGIMRTFLFFAKNLEIFFYEVWIVVSSRRLLHTLLHNLRGLFHELFVDWAGCFRMSPPIACARRTLSESFVVHEVSVAKKYIFPHSSACHHRAASVCPHSGEIRPIWADLDCESGKSVAICNSHDSGTSKLHKIKASLVRIISKRWKVRATE